MNTLTLQLHGTFYFQTEAETVDDAMSEIEAALEDAGLEFDSFDYRNPILTDEDKTVIDRQ